MEQIKDRDLLEMEKKMLEITFYKNNYKIKQYAAENICKITDIINDLKFVTTYNIWVPDSNCVRIYIAMWSQNRKEAHVFIEKIYYDAIDDLWLIQSTFGGEEILTIDYRQKFSFSGAKTRDAFYEFVRAINE